MNLIELKLNRFMYRTDTDSNVENTGASMMLASNNSQVIPSSVNQKSQDEIDAKNVQTGTVIIACFIQTSALPSRVELSGNDMRFYDDSVGGTGSISGDNASIKFIRADEKGGTLVIQKRHGANDDNENVYEVFYSEAAEDGQENYIFIGRNGVSELQNFTDFVTFHAVDNVRAEINCVNDYQSRPSIIVQDYSKTDSSKQGVVGWMVTEGRDGIIGLGKNVQILTFASPTAFDAGDTITGNISGATAYIIAMASTTVAYCDHTSYGINFDVALDDACTTNGAGGGSGTGDLFSQSYANNIVWYVTPDMNVAMGSNVVPDADGAYLMGTTSRRIGIVHTYQLGDATHKVAMYGSVTACPLPTVEDALEVIRRIPEPKYVGERGHYGDRLYIDDLTFPQEMLYEQDGKKEIEHTHMIGLLMQAVRQLTKEVDDLKAKIS